MQVTLWSTTKDMYLTIWKTWHASRTTTPLPSHIDTTEARNLFFNLMNEDIPIMEMIEFIFLLEKIPVSLREQIVRHRMGTKFDGRLGFDMVPDHLDSTFWAQSMRILDMSNFDYFTPESIEKSTKLDSWDDTPLDEYNTIMRMCADSYARLIAAGIPKEDARNVIPLGATHRMVWKLNLKALKHICSKRACWIAQLGLWKPIIQGFINELVKIDARFNELVSPPCIVNNEFQTCKFCTHNQKRVINDGEEMPPCPLYLTHHKKEAMALTNAIWTYDEASLSWGCANNFQLKQMALMTHAYQELWKRNVYTGESL